MSLKPVLDGTVNDLGDRVLVESYNGIVMTKRWRLMHHPKFKKNPEFDSKLLYDMSVDPAQKKDVASAHPEVVSRLNAILEEVNAKTEKGKALPIVKARLKITGFDKTIEVTDDMNEAVFTVPLKKGDCDILAQFIADDGKEYGAYFLYVERK